MENGSVFLKENIFPRGKSWKFSLNIFRGLIARLENRDDSISYHSHISNLHKDSGSQPSRSERFFQLSSISIDQKSRQFIVYGGKIVIGNIN